MSRTLVIAEPGCTAEGDFDTMVRQIHMAADCGADVFKSQWTSEAAQMVARRHAEPKYLEYYGWLEYPIEWHKELRKVALSRKLQYACSVYLPEDVQAVRPLVDYLKISSFENQDQALLREALSSRAKTVIVSTGMLDQWGWAYWRLKRLQWMCGLRLLQCTSSYPVSLDQVQIGAMVASGFDGLSDHSKNMLTGGFAVAAGAQIVETHIALDDCDPENPDYAAALSPAEFEIYVRNIRAAEEARGSGRKSTQGQETWALRYRVGV